MSEPKPQFILTIRALPDRVAPEQRLKGVLKRLLRTWGFQCVSCTPLAEAEAQATEATTETGLEQLRRCREELK